MNLGLHCGDDAECVRQNRARLRALLPAEPRWLHQVHSATVVDAALVDAPPDADASFTDVPDVVCVVSVADCMPVLLADADGRVVGAAHAGWRGLASGVLQATVAAMRARLGEPAARLLAWLGPSIGPQRFEVGGDVRDAMAVHLPRSETAFRALGDGKFLADLPDLARQALAQVGVTEVAGGDACTYSDQKRYYSYRRDRVTGRHAALIWRAR